MSTFTTSRTDISVGTPRTSGSFLLRLLSRIEFAIERYRSRRALMELSDEMLKDIGLSRSEAYREANRRFWD